MKQVEFVVIPRHDYDRILRAISLSSEMKAQKAITNFLLAGAIVYAVNEVYKCYNTIKEISEAKQNEEKTE